MKKLMMIGLLTLMACGKADKEYEVNKRLNFDVCTEQCIKAGTSMGTFEQGMGYVKCTCLPKSTKDGGN